MKRSDKIRKLGMAIKDYRGQYNEKTGDWIYYPDRHARKRVLNWIKRLGLDAEKSLEKIDGFKTVNQYREWIKTL